MSIKRQELKNVIEECAVQAKCEPEVQANLVATADKVEYMAVGTYIASNEISCGCPAEVAGYVNSNWEGHYLSQSAPSSVGIFINRFDLHAIWGRVDLDHREGDEWSVTGYVKVED